MRHMARFHQDLWPIRYKPLEDELLSSWLVRLAHGHGLKVQSFCNMLYGNKRQIWNRDIDRLAPQWLLDDLILHTGANQTQAEQTTLRIFDGVLVKHYREAGPLQWIQLMQMYHRKREGYGQQFCPSCLREDKVPYFRKTWRLAIKTMCLKHNCMLMDRCPQCDSAVSYHRIGVGQPNHVEFESLSTCHECGFDLRTAFATPVKVYDQAAFDWLRQVIADVDDFSAGKSVKVDLKEMTLFHHLTAMVSKERKRYHLGQHVADMVGADDYVPINEARVALESYQCHVRNQYMQFAAWLLVDPQIRLHQACRARAIRHNFLLRDMKDPPAWYEECVNNRISTRARPFFERRRQREES